MEDNTWFHLWLPVRGMISDETYFLESSPEFTITSPGDAKDGMTVTAYQHQDNSLYIQAGRGYNTENVVDQDFCFYKHKGQFLCPVFQSTADRKFLAGR